MSFDKTALRNQIRSHIKSNNFTKAADAITPYVKVRLYEDSYIDRVLKVRQVSEDELVPEIEDDSFYIIANVEQGTENAIVANFTDRPVESYVTGPRYKIPVGMHKTVQRRKNIRELLAYDYDILADAADKDAYELGDLRDWKLMLIMNECVDLSGKKRPDVVDPAKEGPVQIDRIHFNRLGSELNTGGRTGLPTEDRLQVEKFLTSRELLDDLALLETESIGDSLTGEMFQGGVVVENILGLQFIGSIKERFFTEHEHVTRVQFTASSSDADATVTLDGTGITVGMLAADDAAATAEKVADAVKAKDGYFAETSGANGDIVRIRVEASPDEEARTFQSHDPSFSFAAGTTGAGATVLNKGWDRWDTMYAMPAPEFIGEVVQISGQGVETEMWRTDGEDVVNRVSKEFFGMGVGNANGFAKQRVQRSRFLG